MSATLPPPDGTARATLAGAGLGGIGPSRRAWMITFADLVSLLLTFFVMLFAMQKVETKSWETFVESFASRLSAASHAPSADMTAMRTIPATSRHRAVGLDYLASVLETQRRHSPPLSGAQILRLEDRLVVALPGDLLFAPGEAAISVEGRAALYVLGGLLANVGNALEVAGHTDPTPMRAGGPIPSNWELSLARALAVVAEIRRAGYPRRLVALGYAETQFAALPAHLPEAERLALGRRVDIVIRPMVGD